MTVDVVHAGGVPSPPLTANERSQAGVERSGVLCAYPKHAQWSGKGEAGDAANYTCK